MKRHNVDAGSAMVKRRTATASLDSTGKERSYDTRYAITFGEVAILHVGALTEIGQGIRERGFSTSELKELAAQLNDKHGENVAEYISISDALPEASLRESNEAGILVLRCRSVSKDDALSIPLTAASAHRLFDEQSQKVDYDDKFWDSRRSKTLNKRARQNIVFGEDEVTHSEDYRQSSVKAFKNVPLLNAVRALLGDVLGEKARNLNAEGNHYHHDKSGIGFHGDAERKIVVCLSLGKTSVLRYQWRMPGSSLHAHKPVDVVVNHGDIYVMSEKATGYDWRLRSKVRVVHAAGDAAYIDK
eukprot:TRINITY_DN7110_c0_g1_i2.p1 TRINITY_DN7110_c0_g1~~TRINITY_DN7110_c0_g1_i2.p1  ORF type:complete len:302 (+),score=48.56 TRINITY_DN7110_c0_g1_i2:118-1023(+)